MDSRKMKKIILSVLAVCFLLLSISFVAFAEPWGPAIQKFKNLNTFKQEVIADKGVIATHNQLASRTGIQILMQGGNAVDAAVATFFTFSVTGGGMVTAFGAGFMNIYTKNGQAVTLDNYSIAPLAATPNMYTLLYPDDEKKQAEAGLVTVGDENGTGFRSIGVPGNLKAWLWALKNFGSRKLSLREIMQPAMDFARDGFRVTPAIASGLVNAKKRCGIYPGWAEEYIDKNGNLPAPNTISQPV